jgi:hypothetical protein
MSVLYFRCSNCGQQLRLKNDRGRGILTCPNCGTATPWPPQENQQLVPVARGTLERVKDTFMPARVPTSAGQLRPRLNDPDRGALVKLPFVCSATGLSFSVTLGKDKLGEKFHVKSLEPAEKYFQAIQQAGGEIRSTSGRILDLHDTDWTGFQCFHCGAGHCAGDRYDWYRCGVCKSCICGRKVETIHGGGEKAYCPVCAQWSMIGNNGTTGIDAEFFVAERREPASDATAAPRGLRSRLIGLLK